MKKFFTPDHYYDDLDAIGKDFFKKNDIKVIFCDIDNTLVRYSEHTMTEYSARFLKRAALEDIKIVLLSNNTDEKRGGIGEMTESYPFPTQKSRFFQKRS